MAKLTLADLRKMREEKQKALDMRDSSNKDIQVVVGMGTCGIGAKALFTSLNHLPHHAPTHATRQKLYDYFDDHCYVDHPYWPSSRGTFPQG